MKGWFVKFFCLSIISPNLELKRTSEACIYIKHLFCRFNKVWDTDWMIGKFTFINSNNLFCNYFILLLIIHNVKLMNQSSALGMLGTTGTLKTDYQLKNTVEKKILKILFQNSAWNQICLFRRNLFDPLHASFGPKTLKQEFSLI